MRIENVTAQALEQELTEKEQFASSEARPGLGIEVDVELLSRYAVS